MEGEEERGERRESRREGKRRRGREGRQERKWVGAPAEPCSRRSQDKHPNLDNFLVLALIW